MENGTKIKYRDLATALRQLLEDEFTDSELAWAAAMELALTACMRVRGIAGEAPTFFSAAGSPPLPTEIAARTDVLFEAASSLLAESTALGWLNQFWHDGERADIISLTRGDQYAKIGAGTLAPATQVYSEAYMVDFLLENSLGALWLDMHPTSTLAADWRYWTHRPEGQARRQVMPAAAISVCDPACGAGHFLLAAFDMLYDMYCEEGYGEPALICSAILNNNLYGLDIDGRAVAVARAALWLKAQEKAPGLDVDKMAGLNSHIVTVGGRPASAELGSLLIDAETDCELIALLGRRYTVVATNPPYLDKRDYSKTVRAYLRRHYPAGAGNLYAAFILRCLSLSDGYIAMVTPQTFLSISSFAALRREVFGEAALRTLAQLGLGAFTDAVVDAALFVLAREAGAANVPGVYFKLMDAPRKEEALTAAVQGYNAGETRPEVFISTMSDAAALVGGPVAFWLGDGLRKLVSTAPPLRDFADIVLGMKTSDNRRFVRRWWEVWQPEGGEPAGWAPYEKEASGYRYARPAAHFVRWTARARAFYQNHYSAQLPNPRFWFRGGLVFGLISSKGFAAKLLPSGHMTDMAASCVFPHAERDACFLLGLLNSKPFCWLLKMFNPTVNYQPIDLQRLPLPMMAATEQETIGLLAAAAATAATDLRAAELTDRGYRFRPDTWLPLRESMPRRLLEIWRSAFTVVAAAEAIDQVVVRVLALPPAEAASIEAEMGGSLSHLPALSTYEQLPVELANGLFPSPERVLATLPADTAAIKEQLRLLYEAGPAAGQQPEEFFTKLAAVTGLHHVSVYNLLCEGIIQEGWRCAAMEKELAEDFISAVVLTLLGHAWPGQTPAAKPGIALLAPDDLAAQVMASVERWAAAADVAVDFAALTGVSLERWLAKVFFKRHIAQFRRRPLVWQMTSRAGRGEAYFACLVHCQRAGDLVAFCRDQAAGLRTSADQQQLDELDAFIVRLEGITGYQPNPDWGVRVNVAPLQAAGLLAAPVLSIGDLAAALADGRRCRRGEYLL